MPLRCRQDWLMLSCQPHCPQQLYKPISHTHILISHEIHSLHELFNLKWWSLELARGNKSWDTIKVTIFEIAFYRKKSVKNMRSRSLSKGNFSSTYFRENLVNNKICSTFACKVNTLTLLGWMYVSIYVHEYFSIITVCVFDSWPNTLTLSRSDMMLDSENYSNW